MICFFKDAYLCELLCYIYCLDNDKLKLDFRDKQINIPSFINKSICILTHELQQYKDNIDYFIVCDRDSKELQLSILNSYIKKYDSNIIIESIKNIDKYLLTTIFFGEEKEKECSPICKNLGIHSINRLDTDRSLYFSILSRNIKFRSNIGSLAKHYFSRAPYISYCLDKIKEI